MLLACLTCSAEHSHFFHLSILPVCTKSYSNMFSTRVLMHIINGIHLFVCTFYAILLESVSVGASSQVPLMFVSLDCGRKWPISSQIPAELGARNI